MSLSLHTCHLLDFQTTPLCIYNSAILTSLESEVWCHYPSIHAICTSARLSDHTFVFQMADHMQQNASHTQPYSVTKLSVANIHPMAAKCKCNIPLQPSVNATSHSQPDVHIISHSQPSVNIISTKCKHNIPFSARCKLNIPLSAKCKCNTPLSDPKCSLLTKAPLFQNNQFYKSYFEFKHFFSQ